MKLTQSIKKKASAAAIAASILGALFIATSGDVPQGGEWTPQPSHRQTEYGVVHYGGECKDDYKNFVAYDAEPKGEGLVVTLQRPAMKALWEAQRRYAKRTGWSQKRLLENPKGRPIILIPGTNRTCERQEELWRSDPSRYARPEITGHTRGLALDVSRAQRNVRIIDEVLRAAGWEQVRPDDEPWHFSYGFKI